MYKPLLHFFLGLSGLVIFSAASAQSFTGIYTFAGVTTSSGRIDPTPVPTAAGITFGSFQAVGNSSANPNSGTRFNFTGWPTTTTINTGAYFEVIISPQSGYSLTLNTLTFTIQRSTTGVKQFSVRSSTDGFASNLPASFSGSEYTIDAGNVFKVVSTATTAAVANLKVAFLNVSNSISPDTVRIYGWDAGAATGTFSLNRAEFAGSSAPAGITPSLTLDKTSIGFSNTAINTVSGPQQYTVTGANLTDSVKITAPPSFLVADAANGTYGSSIAFAASEVSSAKAVYVKFAPLTTGNKNGNLANTSPGAPSVVVAVSGLAVDPANLNFDFNTCTPAGTPGSGFLAFSVTGPQQFACSQYGRNGTNGVDINGFSGAAVLNEDWLISPSLSIGALAIPILSFYTRKEFTGPDLQLLVSTDYDGTSNPNTASWTPLAVNFAANSSWFLTTGVDLTAYKSASRVYIAFKYTSSPALQAARWTLDDIRIANGYVQASTESVLFTEQASGTASAARSLAVKGTGYGNITITASSGYQVSVDNSLFGSSIQLLEAALSNGTNFYIRFAPQSKAAKVPGQIRFTGTGIDSAVIALQGSSYLRSETFDVGAYNLSFFGSNSTNNPTPVKISTQINKIDTVFERLNLDIIGVEEVSSDSAVNVLLSKLPGYAASLSNRWSYSFDPPDPNFPPQKVGFIYNTNTTQLTSNRVLFERLFDSLRLNQRTLPGYPDSSSHFWSSGRLPYMGTFTVSIGGNTKQVRVIDLHAKAASDVMSYNRRVYDARVLKDSLDAYYGTDNVIIVGDFNDRMYGSITSGSPSPYNIFVNDTANYSVITYPLDSAGRVSFVSGTGLIDHIIISNELRRNLIGGSTDIEDARTYITNYGADSASDHLPIYTRMTLTDQALPVKLSAFSAESRNKQVVINWKTSQEINNDHFVVERSADGKNFVSIARVAGAGTSPYGRSYQTIDSFPLEGVSYYRLQQVDADGRPTTSHTVAVRMGTGGALFVYPNPVLSTIQIGGNSSADYLALVTNAEGMVMIQTYGNTRQISEVMNRQMGKLKTGFYILHLKGAGLQQSLKFMKQ